MDGSGGHRTKVTEPGMIHHESPLRYQEFGTTQNARCEERPVCCLENDTLLARLGVSEEGLLQGDYLPDLVMFKYPFIENGLMSCIRCKTMLPSSGPWGPAPLG